MKNFKFISKKIILPAFLGLVFASIPLMQPNKVEEEAYFMPAYSYTDNYSIEPKYKDGTYTSYGTFTQKDTTYDRMNVGTTWNSFRGEHVKVAVIDTGCNTGYEDFNGTTISSKSYDVYSETTDISDTSGHGTDSAACIAAAINGVGGLGISPNVELHVYKAVNSSNQFPNSALQSALRRAIDDHVDVINLSIQGYTTSFSYSYIEDLDGKTYRGTMSASSLSKTTLQSLITEAHDKGITVVAAAGNYNTTNTSYPAANDYVIGVGSTSLNDGSTKAGYSNNGTYVDICAPGYVVVPSTSDAAYRLYYGTSFSAPLVTGAIALYKSKYPSATPDQIETQLYATCDSLSYSGSGHGKINVTNFLNNGPSESWVMPTGIDLPTSETLVLDQTKTLTPTFTPLNASRQSCYWSVGDSSIVSVDQFGNIKGLKVGITTVTATSVDGSYSDTCSINVGAYVPATNLSLSLSSASLEVGETQTITSTITPSNATDKYICYVSSDETVATVSDEGVITAIGEGTATITGLMNDGPEDEVSVTVSDSRTWNLVHSVSELSDGDKVIFALGSKESSFADFNTSYFRSVSTTFSSDYSSLTPASTTLEMTLIKAGSYWKLMNGTKYVRTTAAKAMSLTTDDSNNLWTISIDSNASATIQSSNSEYGRILWNYNNGTPRYSTYTSPTSSTMMLPSIYRYGKVEPLVLDSIAVSNPQTTYTVGDAFVEPTVIATYDNGNSSPVSGATFSGYNLSNTGNQSVNVSYTENGVTKTTSYSITVNEAPIVLSFITVKTNPTKVAYNVGDHFDPTGLVITKHYSDSSTEDVSYIDASSDFSFSPTTSASLALSHTKVTVTYMSKTVDISISVTQGEMEMGNMSISKTKFSSISGDLDTNISFLSSKGNAGTAPGIYNNAIRLYQGSSNKYGGYITISTKNNCQIKSIVFSVTNTYATTYAHGTSTSSLSSSISIAKSGEAVISPVNSSSYVIANMGQSSSARLEVYSITVNYYSPLKAAQDWSDSFMDDLVCDSTGVTPPSVSQWNTLAGSYNDLDVNAKAYFVAASITDTKVLNAVTKYDYIIVKYGTSTYTNFMNRSASSSLIHNPIVDFNDNNCFAIITIISIASITTILGYVILKKRKSVND